MGFKAPHAQGFPRRLGNVLHEYGFNEVIGFDRVGEIAADSLYQHLLFTAEKKFWRCVENGEPPRLFGLEPPRPRIEAVRIVDMSASNAWAEFAGVFQRTRGAYLEHENAKTELKALMPEDAKEAIGQGIRARRSKSGAVSFDVLSMEGSHAPLQ